MTVTAGKITFLTIANSSRKNEIVFQYGALAPEKAKDQPKEEPKAETKKEEPKPAGIGMLMQKEILALAEKAQVDLKAILTQAQVKDLAEMEPKAGADMIRALKRKITRMNTEKKEA